MLNIEILALDRVTCHFIGKFIFLEIRKSLLYDILETDLLLCKIIFCQLYVVYL